MVLRIRYSVLKLCLILSALVIFIILLYGGKTETIKNLPVSEKIIVVDAGHGGRDGGTQSKDGALEKDINLEIAKYLENYLTQSGAKVIMTRTKDVSLHESENNKKRSDLNKRREIVNGSGGDAFISIHVNSFEQEKYKGAQVFYELKNPKSYSLAQDIQQNMIEILDKTNNRTISKIPDNKALYKDLKVPSVLVECGFLSNPEEAKLLADKDYQKKIAYSIYMGILNFFSN